MTAATAPAGAAGLHHVRVQPFYGFGSVYAKTLRDSRLALIIVCGLIGAFLLLSGVAFGEAYTTVESRLELKALVAALPPAMAGVYGNPFPTAIETLGGSIAWKTAADRLCSSIEMLIDLMKIRKLLVTRLILGHAYRYEERQYNYASAPSLDQTAHCLVTPLVLLIKLGRSFFPIKSLA